MARSSKRLRREEVFLLTTPLLVVGAIYGASYFRPVPEQSPALKFPSKFPRPLPRPYASHIQPIAALTFSPDGRMLASAAGGEVFLWSVNQGTLRKTKVLPPPKSILYGKTFSKRGRIYALAFSPNGKTLALGGDYDTYKPVKMSDGKPAVEVTSQGILELHTVASGTLLHASQTFSPVQSIAFSPDGRQVASGEGHFGYGCVRLWNTKTGQQSWTTPQMSDGSDDTRSPAYKDKSEVQSLAFAPNGKFVASIASACGRGQGTCGIRLWKATTGTIARRLPDGTSGYSSNADERYTMSLAPNGNIVAFNRLGTTLSREGITLADVQNAREMRQLNFPDVQVQSIAFSPDGKVVAAGGEHNLFIKGSYKTEPLRGRVRFWDVASGAVLGTIKQSDPIVKIAWSPQGRTLATGTGNFRWGEIKLWDTTPYTQSPQ